jgi:mannose-6-phosphate isomerase-like protein (cupin superfamily)
MMRPGQVLTHPLFGTRLTFLRTAAETEGRLLEWETLYKAHRGKESGNIPHFHVTFVEQYEVLEGTAAYELKGEERQAGAGAHVEIPRGAVHRNLWNASDADLRLRTHIEMNPPNLRAALFIEDFFETLYGLARDGKVNAEGLPKSYLHTALLVQGFQPETWVAGSPIPIQRVLTGTLAALGRARGYRTKYPQYDAAT